MKKIRVISLLLVAAIAAASLSGCTQSAGTNTEEVEIEVTDDAETEEEAQEEEPESEAEESDEEEVQETEEPQQEADTEESEEEEPQQEFAVEEKEAVVMYAKRGVNVRKGPSQDYEKIGSLSAGQEITVTGVADTGWYQITYQDQTGYCSNNYLQADKPVIQQAKVSNNTGGTAANETASDTAAKYKAAAGGRDLEAEYRAAMAAGDLELAEKIMGESLAIVTDGRITDAHIPRMDELERNVSASREFINYLNKEREELSLTPLEWDEDMAQTAVERAEEIVDDFSHNKVRNCGGENILSNMSGDVASWYQQFYDSKGHRMNMLADLWTKGAAAYCQVGRKYYVVVMFDM